MGKNAITRAQCVIIKVVFSICGCFSKMIKDKRGISWTAGVIGAELKGQQVSLAPEVS